MNKWNIPLWLEKEVRSRDKFCVYCGIKFTTSNDKKTKATWEHIINDATIVTIDNIGLCCTSCNASKGAKLLVDWLHSDYCQARNISSETVAPIIKRALSFKI